MLPLVKPVFRSLRLKVSTAFATMQVSNWRRASSSSSVNTGADAIVGFLSGNPS
jgi:hypothetical protein